MDAERQNKEETTSNSPNMERKERGKFVSLSKLEAKIVLETYVKRSLSNYEGKSKGYKKEKKVQRSGSDVSRLIHKANKTKIMVAPKSKLLKNDKKGSDNCLTTHEPVATTKASSVKKQSWFKGFLSQLFNKEENTSEQTVSVVNKRAQSSVADISEGHSDQIAKKNSLRKDSLRKALSFKKNATDKKLKRPSNLPLKQICRPHPFQPCEANEDCYYEQVSAEIELLVKETDKMDLSGSRQSSCGDIHADQTQNIDAMVKKIVAILQKEGDACNKKIKEDPTLRNFFTDISYTSFKQLADVYVEKEVKRSDSELIPEDMKFAFSVHLTKQVIGLSAHPASRIMGFGNQYIQDSLQWLSYSRENLAISGKSEAYTSPD